MASRAGLLPELEVAESPDGPEARIIEAALRCIARWGLAKTTLDDVARQAGCSRATVYRVFPGGKEPMLQAVGRREVSRVCTAVWAQLDGARSLEQGLTEALATAAGLIAHHPALPLLLAHEPETVLPWLAFERGERLLDFVSAAAAPHLARWLSPGEARRAGEWAARILLSFCFCPSPGLDLTDPAAARRIVSTFVLPGLLPVR